jgi:hypothetical protein
MQVSAMDNLLPRQKNLVDVFHCRDARVRTMSTNSSAAAGMFISTPPRRTALC